MKPAASPMARGLAALRQFAAPKPTREACEMCAKEIPERHRHLVNVEKRTLLCVCDACSILFDHAEATAYRRVPLDSRELTDANLSDSLWNGLGIPAGILFILRSSVSGRAEAFYPSPAGPTEADLDANFWDEISGAHASIQTMMPDVEALLVNRANGARQYFIVPIDECYKLTALIRKYWQGFSGGKEAWDRIDSFFADLRGARLEGASVRA
jgi:Family of unknown function (DUF5947)